MAQYNIKSKMQTTQFYKFGFHIILLLSLYSWLEGTVEAMDVRTNHCPITQDNSFTPDCKYGEYLLRSKYRHCKDRVMCYRGPGEFCSELEEFRCADGLVCRCGLCQNCVDQDCEMRLCPGENNILKRWIKRFEHNLLEYNA